MLKKKAASTKLAALCPDPGELLPILIAMKISPVTSDVLLVVVNIALIVTNIFQISVAVSAVATKIPFVMTRVSPIFGKSGGVAGALVTCNLRAVVI